MSYSITVVDSEMYEKQEIKAITFWGVTKRGYLKKVSRISEINCEIKQPKIFRYISNILLILKKSEGKKDD